VDNYWAERAKRYDNLDWVKDGAFLSLIIDAGEFSPADRVLDVGTGTGIISRLLSPLVRHVTAIDSSPDMLNKTDGLCNVDYRLCDVRDLPWKADAFDKVVARYVFHHITLGASKAMAECYRVLRPNGIMVFAEGVPPSNRTRQDFIDIFKLKEDRLTFMPEDMYVMMHQAGFETVVMHTLWLPQMSVRNWLESSDLSKEKQDVIYKMHTDAPDYFKHDYHLTVTENDCRINMKVVVMAGVK